ncbi:uncharacterized protein C8R40DRAFT_1176254 [Lentinula edodes]|uniref:uncharacterized protein n=1 Tax=Lentinula edodes TaxID=5353 RepID=UPI001E8EAAFC|nr:uncharacterized protein C8R40DRAFT_1176254 [Lentinula edodes]KAH7869929.1 hypothetical protein C8R40DRAFT_1176254 [Lentinula edodes]
MHHLGSWLYIYEVDAIRSLVIAFVVLFSGPVLSHAVWLNFALGSVDLNHAMNNENDTNLSEPKLFALSLKSIADIDMKKTREAVLKPPFYPQSSPEVRFDGKTVVVTGAGAGLGRVHALMYSTLGANVVVNDYLLTVAGGKATTAVCLAEDGETIVKAALDDFGGVHILGC